MNRRNLLVLSALAPVALAAPIAAQDEPTADLVQQFLTMYDAQNWDAADGFMSPDYAPLYGLASSFPGLDAWKQRRLSDTFNNLFASVSTTPLSIATNGDMVFVMAESTVTKHGGAQAVLPWLFVLKVQDGVIVGGHGGIDQAYITDVLTT